MYQPTSATSVESPGLMLGGGEARRHTSRFYTVAQRGGNQMHTMVIVSIIKVGNMSTSTGPLGNGQV